jgi:hypothetical protein
MKFIKSNYEGGDQVIIYGYSYGGDDAAELTDALDRAGIPVDLLVTVDASDGPAGGATVDRTVPGNVAMNLNVFQTNSSGTSSGSHIVSGSGSNSGSSNFPGSRGRQNLPGGRSQSVVVNANVTAPGTTHGNIQERAANLIDSFMQSTIKKN